MILTEIIAICFEVSSQIFHRMIHKEQVKNIGKVTLPRGDLCAGSLSTIMLGVITKVVFR